MSKTFYTSSADETTRFAAKFASNLKKGDVVSLIGDLGSGKTTFVKGIALGLGVKDNVRSSSFVVVSEYDSAKTKLFHIDLYRLGENDFEMIGLDDYVFGGGVCVIEWADRVLEEKLRACYRIKIFWQDENKRKIEIEKIGRDR